MTRGLSRHQVRELDRRASEEFGVPGIVLMENAGRNAAALLLQLRVSGPVAVCAGKGNNGGDGLVIARHLDAAGVAVRILLFADPASLVGDAAINFRVAERSGILVETPAGSDAERIGARLVGAEWVVDALFGTGLDRPLRPPFDAAVAAINASGAKVLAVDIPSGLDCDTGLPLGATVRAHHTVTFVAPKIGFGAPEAAEWLGTVHVAGIGAPRKLVEEYVGREADSEPSRP